MEYSKQEKYLPEFVYGAIDGTITTFAIVSGAMGAELAAGVVLVLGIANVLADGLSMASGNYLSEKSERAVQGGEQEKKPFRTATATFVSFVTVGMVPLLPFVLALALPSWRDHAFLYSILATVVAFVGIGWVRGAIGKENRLRSVVETLLIGAMAAGVSYYVGYLLRGLVDAI